MPCYRRRFIEDRIAELFRTEFGVLNEPINVAARPNLHHAPPVIHSWEFIHSGRCRHSCSYVCSNKVGGMSAQQDEIRAALDAVAAGYARLRDARSDSVGNAFRVEVAQRLETQHRINRGQMYRFVGEITDPPDGPTTPTCPQAP